jgi:group I intron endonuclease
MYGIIYRATGPTGKVYIGQTTKTLNRRKSDHACRAKKGDRRGAFQLALLEYGLNAFQWEQIDTAATAEELSRKEKHWIAHYRADDPAHGFNLTAGGTVFSPTPETRQKISEALKGRHLSVEHRHKLSKAKKSKSGNLRRKILSPEHRQKLSESHRGIQVGEKSPVAKLTNKDARQIRIALANGESGASLARKYGVCETTIRDIKNRKKYKTA